ncbi:MULTISPECIES: DegV family protein [Aeromicrobium]|jgi:DegV family protein with EDD domain|uniref:DegV domain-containing protein n=1 Tax=Aeromicrobium erythreum TaxID=2041 RepID=A0A0U4AYA2_9ACTN|nr:MULTISPECIES: DegV family protein [Aeromicrobium]ALX05312.1 DegV domain-containing protein [Aeromicrobium erythreum]
MAARRIAVVTDSTASLDPADAEREGITVVPLKLVIGAATFTEGVDATSDDVAQALKDFVPVSTSRPTPEEFAAVYARLAQEGHDAIVSVHLSAEISGTFESAQVAAREAPVPVMCVDTRQVGIATGFAAGRAAAVARAGGDEAAAVGAALAAGESSSVLMYVDTLEYLRRGGRVGAATALIGSALAVKPLLTLRDGVVVPLERVRTSAKAVARLEALVAEAAEAATEGYDIGVQHLANPDLADQVAERLAGVLGRDRLPVNEVGAVIGAHVGPGMLAVTVTPRPG